MENKKLKIIQIFGTIQRFFLIFSRRINIFSSDFSTIFTLNCIHAESNGDILNV